MNTPDGHTENALIAWFTRTLSDTPDGVILGVGDDMAILETPAHHALLSSDMLLDGVHFDLSKHTLHDIGHKAAGCVLSDCAAMAGEPVAAVVSLALPKSFGQQEVAELYSGMRQQFDTFGVSIIGGDTTAWNSGLVIDVSLMGRPVSGSQPIRRSGARDGDLLYITGFLGGSIRGHHLRFTPRIREAMQLITAWGPDLHAMIDITDGLAIDLHRMCDASGMGAELDAPALQNVASEDAKALASEDGRGTIEHVLSDGEDFELLIAADPGATIQQGHEATLHRIGRITTQGVTLKHADGKIETLSAAGYDHLK